MHCCVEVTGGDHADALRSALLASNAVSGLDWNAGLMVPGMTSVAEDDDDGNGGAVHPRA